MQLWDIGLDTVLCLVKVAAEVLRESEWITEVGDDEHQLHWKLLQPWDLWFISLTSLTSKHSF